MEKLEKTKGIDVSIIIPAKDEETIIEKCLKAILNQKTAYKFEVLVIDSGSSDATIDVVNRFKSVKLINIIPEKFGHGRTRNFGVKQSRGKYIVFLNADAIPINSFWLDSLIVPLEEDKSIAGVFSRHTPREDCYLYMVRDIQTSMPEHKKLITRAGVFDTLLFSTVSSSVRRAIFEKTPFLDDIIIAEDQEWAIRILNQGFKILYEPDSVVRHSHNYSNKELFESKRKIGATSIRFKSKFWVVTAGFLLMIGGIVAKTFGDIFYILCKSPRKTSWFSKFKEIKIGFLARLSSFRGRYQGWKGRFHE
jgi:rhamnosyltransferase